MIRHPARCLLLLVAMTLQLSACSDDSTNSSQDTTPSGSTPTQTSDEATWTLLASMPEGPRLEAGAYALTAYTSVHSLAVVQAPEGFARYDDWTFVAGDEFGDTGEPFHAMGYTTTDLVFGDPCDSKRHPRDETIYYPGEAVADLAQALVAQKGAITSDPVPVTIDEYDGLYLDYRVPDMEAAHCEGGDWEIFPGWRLTGTGERAGIWILDVDGQRVLLGWVAKQGVTPEQIEEMTRMVESTTFVDPR